MRQPAHLSARSRVDQRAFRLSAAAVLRYDRLGQLV